MSEMQEMSVFAICFVAIVSVLGSATEPILFINYAEIHVCVIAGTLCGSIASVSAMFCFRANQSPITYLESFVWPVPSNCLSQLAVIIVALEQAQSCEMRVVRSEVQECGWSKNAVILSDCFVGGQGQHQGLPGAHIHLFFC